MGLEEDEVVEEEDAAKMVDTEVVCNFRKCRKRLTNFAWVMRCCIKALFFSVSLCEDSPPTRRLSKDIKSDIKYKYFK